MLIQSFIAFMATLGFGILFNIRGRKLFFAGLGGGISWFVYIFAKSLDFSGITAMLISSIVLSTYSEIFARILKTPVTTLVICALIPLVPGCGMYYTMVECVTGNVIKALELGLNTVAEAGSLSLGVILVSTITRQMMSAKRKLEIKNLGQNKV